jgi:YbbR domain-containing protein
MEEVQVTIPIEESDGFADKLITIDWVGYPAPGYRLLSASVDPPSLLVTGLPTRLNALTRLKTEPIDITGLTGTFNQQATLALPAGVSLDQDQEIFVTIEIEPILSTDTHERPIEMLGLRGDMEASLDPEQVRVVLFGPLPALDSLVADDVRVTVDLFELISGTHSIEPVVDLPERGIEVRSIRPESVSVTITRTITPTDEITGTLPVTESNDSLEMIIARTKLNEDAAIISATGSAALPVASHFLSPTTDLAQFADSPKRRNIA